MTYPEAFVYHGIQYSRLLEACPNGEWKLTYVCSTFDSLPPLSVVVPSMSPNSNIELETVLAIVRNGIAFTWATYVKMTEGVKKALMDGDRDLAEEA